MAEREEKQALVRIPKELHAEVKARAALRGLSMTSYIERVLTEQIAKEKKFYDIAK